MKINIEYEIDLKYVVKCDYEYYGGDILQASIEDVLDSVGTIEEIHGLDRLSKETKEKILEEYLKLAKEKVIKKG